MKFPRATLSGLHKKYGEKKINLLMDEEFTPEINEFLDGLEYRKVVTPLSDKDVPERFQESAKKWRRLARAMGWNGPVAYLVKAGYSLGKDPKFIQKYGDTKEELGEPTMSSLVFCILLFAREFIGQTQTAPLNQKLFGQNAKVQTAEGWSVLYDSVEQIDLLALIRKKYELPEHHLAGFGSPNTLAVLIQSHFRRTGERIPPYLYKIHYEIRTDMPGLGGLQLALFLDEKGIAAPRTAPNYGRADIGCLPIGVEILEEEK